MRRILLVKLCSFISYVSVVIKVDSVVHFAARRDFNLVTLQGRTSLMLLLLDVLDIKFNKHIIRESMLAKEILLYGLVQLTIWCQQSTDTFKKHLTKLWVNPARIDLNTGNIINERNVF